jgi:transposase
MATALTITRTEHSATELRAVAGGCRDGAQVRRLLALALVLDGLKSRHGPGPSPALTEQQMAELKALVIKGPDPATDKVVRWRCVDLRQEVARRFNVTVHESTIGKWLHQLSLTRLQPRPFHPKKDAAAQEAYKKTSPAWSAMPCSGPPPARR